MTDSDDRQGGFVGYLQSLAGRDDRAALAALRRGLGKGPGEAGEMFRYVVPWTGELRGWREEVYYLVASLFALHPENWQGGVDGESNLGASLAMAARKGGETGVERRFVAMLNSDRDSLPDHLRHAVAFCKSAEIPIDWGKLLRQLPHWDAEGRSVQRDWARAFWRTPASADKSDGETDPE